MLKRLSAVFFVLLIGWGLWVVTEQSDNSVYYFELDSPARSVSISPNNRWVAVGDDAGKITVFDTAERDYVLSYTHHHSSVTGLVFNAHSKLLASTDVHGSLVLWSMESSQVIFTKNDLNQPSQANGSGSGSIDSFQVPLLNDIAFNANGEVLFVGGAQGFIAAVDARDGRIKWSIRGHPIPQNKGRYFDVRRIATQFDRGLLATGSSGGDVSMWRCFDLEY